MSRIGIIGGSGLYKINGLEGIKEVKLDTPFGPPSDSYITGKLRDAEVVFLPRHGRGHRILPSELNYRANIYGMKKLGVEQIISISAVGSFKKELKPLDIVLPDQFVDRTNQGRKTTFFGDGIVGHISFAEPVCSCLKDVIYKSAKGLGLNVHNKGTYLNMEGPAFSTKAESRLYKGWGMDIIGMTNMPEARLAREAEICFATVAFVTDYDCWHEEIVTIEMVIENLTKNVDAAKRLIKKAAPDLAKKRDCQCAEALKYAIITDRKLMPEDTKKKLDIIIGKYIS
ncbi:MAG: S-methyl-5'-thioadenosine phosphorylase [Candidatus Omnitrophica bacterium]|nr:S-methyl-5'-thioadenosine phosphorylase [Candidatus Omnitrophota bacterium]MBU4457861.1 S-methyl-5'-thioadenosine phosphorylase [Candidatus Omnitrophota bacterium]